MMQHYEMEGVPVFVPVEMRLPSRGTREEKIGILNPEFF